MNFELRSCSIDIKNLGKPFMNWSYYRVFGRKTWYDFIDNDDVSTKIIMQGLNDFTPNYFVHVIKSRLYIYCKTIDYPIYNLKWKLADTISELSISESQDGLVIAVNDHYSILLFLFKEGRFSLMKEISAGLDFSGIGFRGYYLRSNQGVRLISYVNGDDIDVTFLSQRRRYFLMRGIFEFIDGFSDGTNSSMNVFYDCRENKVTWMNFDRIRIIDCLAIADRDIIDLMTGKTVYRCSYEIYAMTKKQDDTGYYIWIATKA